MEKGKKYYEKNKEKIADYYIENKEKRAEYRKSENGKKHTSISNWKYIGVIHENFDELYELYIRTNECNVCKVQFKNTKDRCLDHDHDTGKFRQILCHSCNTRDSWKKKVQARD